MHVEHIHIMLRGPIIMYLYIDIFLCVFSKLFWLSPHSYACTRSGHVLEIHYSSVSLKRVWHLLPGNQGGVAITVLCLHEAFSVTGSEDGVLRVWPSDFSSPFLEAGMCGY